MASDQRALDRLRAQARQARADGYFAQAARLERQAVDLAGTLGLVGERTRALLWEGYSLRQAGEDDLALAALLQAANERAATADPADVFSALIAIIHISLERKTAAFCRSMLEQGRRYLADVRQPWSALLDFLEGELAYRRGDFTAAWDWHSRAWADWRDESPRLTAATHLWALCRVAFRRQDLAELERSVERLIELRPTQFLERQLAQRARLLYWRARRATDSTRPTPEAAPVEIAMSLLAESADGRNHDFGARHEALRVLALTGRWEEVDKAIAGYPLQPNCFESALLLGDLALNRTRTAMGLPVEDDDYGDNKPIVSKLLALSLSTEMNKLSGDMRRHFQAASVFSEDRDSRLETKWHTWLLHRRI